MRRNTSTLNSHAASHPLGYLFCYLGASGSDVADWATQAADLELDDLSVSRHALASARTQAMLSICLRLSIRWLLAPCPPLRAMCW